MLVYRTVCPIVAHFYRCNELNFDHLMLIRPVATDDITLLSEFWYDNMALLQQTNPRVRLLPTARAEWEAFATRSIADATVIFLAAEDDASADVLGCIHAMPTANAVGLAPARIGRVGQIVLDIHSPHKQRRTGHHLWQAVKSTFAEMAITHVRIEATLTAPVMQAFWRGVGAVPTDNIFWITLDS